MTEKTGSLTQQAREVLEYLKAGRTLTVQIAVVNLHINSLTRRITELRRHGFDIRADWDVDQKGKKYRKYWLVPAIPAANTETAK